MSDKPTSAVAGVTNVVKQINAALATIPREVTVTATTVTISTQGSSVSTGLLAELRSTGAR